MRTILIPTGPPGAGKSTFCNGLQQFMRAVARPCSVGNLDPANDNIPYDADFDVRELVNVDEVMEREELGPNGGVLWAMEEVETNLDWLLEKLEDCGMQLLSKQMIVMLLMMLQRKQYYSIPQAKRNSRLITLPCRGYFNE